MRALFLVAALAFACKREKPVVKADPDEKKHAKTAGITITKVAPRVGSRARVAHTTNTTMALAGMPGLPSASAMELKERTERTEEVLAVEGSIVTRLRVTYDVHEVMNNVLGSTGAKTPSAVEGNTYVIDATKTGLDITDAKGKPAAHDAKSIIERDYKSIGKEDEISRAIPDVPVRVGDLFPALGSAIKATFTEKALSEMKGDLHVRVEAANNETVTFAVKGTVSVSQSMIEVSIPLTGKIAVQVTDGSITEYSFSGPLTMASDAGLSGTGNLAYTSKWTYLTPPK